MVLARDIPTHHFYALKIMTVSEVIRLRQVEHVNNEKNILASISHPFIVNMYGCSESVCVCVWGMVLIL